MNYIRIDMHLAHSQSTGVARKRLYASRALWCPESEGGIPIILAEEGSYNPTTDAMMLVVIRPS